MLQKLATLPLAFSPGTSFEYSIATDLLGHIIERITKKPLDVALKELVLDPLRMNDTTFRVRGDAVERYARPLATDPDMWVFDWLTSRGRRSGFRVAPAWHPRRATIPAAADAGQWRNARRRAPALADDRSLGAGGSDRHHARRRASRVMDIRGTWSIRCGSRRRRRFPGHVGDVFWGGITGPRYFVDPKEKLIGIVFVQGPAIRAAYHAELSSMVYGAMTSSKDDK